MTTLAKGLHVNPDFKKAIIGGFIGTVALTVLMRFVAPAMGVTMDMAAMIGARMGAGSAVGMVAHFMLGTIVFALAYAVVAYRILPGPPWARGALFGLGLWMMLELVAMPMMGVGVFGGGAPTVMAALMAHLVFGALLGAIAGRPRTASPA
jgi:uncharacterized membrane protein YagU involved in acid resistance